VKKLKNVDRVLIIFITTFALFFSCSRSAPEIPFGFITLNYYQEKNGPEERFSFFIIAKDEDGINNIAELYLYNDKEQLRWTILPEDWIVYEEDGKTWIGSRSIAMDKGERLPRGLFRAVLINKGGEKTERTFTFDAPEESRFPFPSLTISNNEYHVSSNYPDNHLIFYDAQGNNIKTVNLNALSGPLSELDISSEIRIISLWAEDPEYFTSALTDVVPIH
jgi:hypothetical protein